MAEISTAQFQPFGKGGFEAGRCCRFMAKPDVYSLIVRFTGFLEAYAKAAPEQQQAFRDFISGQTRSELYDLAEALRKVERPADAKKPNSL
jgi:hypothetical protein